MIRRWVLAAALACAAAPVLALVEGCSSAPPEDVYEDNASLTSEVTSRDWLEGAYHKQGGTALFAVFRRNDQADGGTASRGTYFGQIDVGGDPQRAEGTFTVSRDNLGTVITMDLQKGGGAAATADAGTRDAGSRPADAGSPAVGSADLVSQAFDGRLHFLKIGKNDTILVRADATGKTGQYTKVGTWCATDADCAETKQRTDLTCTSRECTTKNACECASP